MHEPDATTFGDMLLNRARERGVRHDLLLSLLGMTPHQIRRLTQPRDLADYPLDVIRQLAERLGLPWPEWLATGTAEPTATPEPNDAAMVDAVLSAAIGLTLSFSELAYMLDWTIDRVQVAVHHLKRRTRTPGTQIVVTGDSVVRELTSRLLDDDTRRRLNMRLHAHGIGPSPDVLYLVYHLISSDWAAIQQAGLNPEQNADLYEEARAYGLITSHESYGFIHADLTRDVRISLGVRGYLHSRVTYLDVHADDDDP